jgi:uncharacterized membrane protein
MSSDMQHFMKSRTKSLLGILGTCLGGGATYVFASQYFNISADATTTTVNQNNGVLFLIVSAFVTICGILLLIFTIISDRRDQR